MGWDAGEALDGGDGSDHVYGPDLRLPSTARDGGEGGSSADAAIAVAKKKNDRIDAGRIADCLRCDLLPECYMAPIQGFSSALCQAAQIFG